MNSDFHPLYFRLTNQSVIETVRGHGIDLSKYDLFFKPEEATGQLDFVVQRIGYGTTRDEAFEKLVDPVMRVPIRGGYHYYSTWIDWKLQADKYLSYVSGYDYHFHVGDFEAAFNSLSIDAAKRHWNWIHYVQDKTGKPCLLYTSPSLYNQWIYPSQAAYGINWNDVDLWSAQWFFVPNPNGNPSTPRGRTKPWKLWQYTDQADGTKYGVARPTACDLDVYNGTPKEMMDWLKIDQSVPDGGTVEDKYFKITADALNIRSSPASLSDNDLGTFNLAKNDIVHAVEFIVNGTVTWHRIDKIWRNGVPIFFPVFGQPNYSSTGYWASGAWMIDTSNPSPLPATLKHTIDILSDGSLRIDGTPYP